MKNFILVLTVLAAGVAAQAHEGTGGKEVAVKGELLDMACYMGHEGHGKGHVECGKMCVLKNGAPLGLLGADGKVYLLVEDHSSPKARKPYAAAKELVGETVVVKGDLHQRGGLSAIVVESAAKE